MRKYDLSAIMRRAWSNYRKMQISFSEALHRAWQSAKSKTENQKRIAEAQQAAGITGTCNTFSGWKQAGYEVIHGMKAAFKVSLIWSSRGDGKSYQAAFFTSDQVQPITV